MRFLLATWLALAAISPAAAINQAVKDACKADYHAYCDKLEVESEALRACMRKNALKLSKPCLQALVDNNEVTKADIDRYWADMAKAKKTE